MVALGASLEEYAIRTRRALWGLISAVQPRAVETQTRSAEKLIVDGMKRRSPVVVIGP